MNTEQKFNPQVVHDAAAFLYWTMAEAIGVPDTHDAVMETGGHCLLVQEYSASVMSQYGYSDLPPAVKQAFDSAIASEAERFSIKGENLLGTIYAEDAQTGRSPSAENVDTEAVRAIPTQIMGNESVKKFGRLCLRHPLPAVVFSDTPLQSEIIEVKETTEALGFHLPMFLTGATCQKISDELFVLTGVFHIPVADSNYGDLWCSVIQNANKFVSRASFHLPKKTIEIQINW